LILSVLRVSAYDEKIKLAQSKFEILPFSGDELKDMKILATDERAKNYDEVFAKS
jgi:hypothetical protein